MTVISCHVRIAILIVTNRCICLWCAFTRNKASAVDCRGENCLKLDISPRSLRSCSQTICFPLVEIAVNELCGITMLMVYGISHMFSLKLVLRKN